MIVYLFICYFTHPILCTILQECLGTLITLNVTWKQNLCKYNFFKSSCFLYLSLAVVPET